MANNCETVHYRDPDAGPEVPTVRSVLATPGQVAMALAAPIDDDVSRGEWRWFRTDDGSLIFGFFPFESVYEQAVNGPEPIGI